MQSSLLITLEIALVLGVAVGLGGWDLWSLGREQARDRLRAQIKADVAASGTATAPEPKEH